MRIILVLLVIIPFRLMAEDAVEEAQRQHTAEVDRLRADYDTKLKASDEKLLAKLKSEMTKSTQKGISMEP